MSLDKETVARIARLARLKVPDEELEPLAGGLSGILAWIEPLNEVDTANVAPLASVSDVTLPTVTSSDSASGMVTSLLFQPAFIRRWKYLKSPSINPAMPGKRINASRMLTEKIPTIDKFEGRFITSE